jgi:hypothetical protein
MAGLLEAAQLLAHEGQCLVDGLDLPAPGPPFPGKLEVGGPRTKEPKFV